uniref:hypothetical protein n=1 Tax=Cupriavidus gilardii TaxID=82541 RepID=UPI0024792AF9|nr:hypothetical protein [Cupriavidus gilardii]WDE72688.1 hypothetical protein [Cupriavidus gilardii]
MTIHIPIGATVIVHRAGQMDQRYIMRGGMPPQFEDEHGNICERSPLDEGFHSLTVTDPATGQRTFYQPR